MKARNCWGSKLSKGEIMAIHQISLVLVNGDVSKYRIPPKCWVEMGWTGLIVIVKQVWFFYGPYVSGQEHLKAIQSYRLSKNESKEQGRYVDDFPIVPSHTLTFNRWLVDIWKKLNHPPYPPIHHCLDLPWFLYNKKVVLSMFTQKIRREDFQCFTCACVLPEAWHQSTS